MHEFSVAEGLIETAADEARRAGASRVRSLTCRVGVLRQIDPSLLQEAFRAAADSTACAGAALVIEQTRMTVLCPQCDQRFNVDADQWTCPACAAEGVDPRGGDELELRTIDVEMSDEN